MSKKGTIIFIVIIALALLSFFLYQRTIGSAPAPLAPFVACLKEKNVLFYGAFWCPHCASQKKLFGKAAKDLPYVECSTPDGETQTPVCALNKIAGYPTWVFSDGSRITNEVSLETLAEKTGCELPKTSEK